MPFLHPPRLFQPLCKEWDYKAQRKGFKRKVYSVNGNVYAGEWLNNKKHGKGLYTWTKTDTVYTGDWLEDKRSGQGTLTKGKKKGLKKEYCGGWKDGLRDGYGTFFYSEKEFYEGEWSAGKKSGWGRMFYKDGTIYEGEWDDDKRCGQGLFQMNNGNRYEGTWANDVKNGSGKLFYLDTGQIFEGIWKDDIPKYGVMRDYGRDSAPYRTPYPIPEIKLANAARVLSQADVYLNVQGSDISQSNASGYETQTIPSNYML